MRIASILAELALVAVLMLAGPAALAGDGSTTEVAPPVTLNSDIVVEGDRVTLGDLFDGVGRKASTPIARAPEPGERVRLPADWLARVARAYAIDWQPASKMQDARLRRAGQRVDAEQIAEAIRTKVTARDGTGGNIEVELDSPSLALTLPVTVDFGVEVAALRYDPETGRFTANVMAPSAERSLASATVSGRAVAMIDVPVLTRRIGRGEIVAEDDLAWTRMAADRLGRNHLTDPEEIVGQSARRGLRPDTALRATDLEKPVVVSKDSLVTLLLETRRMRLTAQGRALENGAAGEVVRVRNTKSNTTVTGVVRADGSVSVAANADRTQSAQN